jgi:ribosomal protein L11 methyltransferase
MIQKQQWIEIAIELEEYLQDPVANFLIELGAEGVITDEDIINPLTGTIKPGKKNYKLLKSYLKKDSGSQEKIESLHHYIKSLVEIHSLPSPPELKLSISNEEDWNKKWQKFFSTTRIGKHIVIKPTWELFLPEEDDLLIEMDPGMAFGTGTHATTRMCLEVLETIMEETTQPIQSMLDVGIGSGILSIAGAKLGIPRIVGIDIDPTALRYAQKNIDNNQASQQIELREVSLKKLEGTFDLVVANILSDILIKLRKDLYEHLADDGFLILSGILAENASKLERKFTSLKLMACASYSDTDWICQVLQKKVA